MSEGGPSFGDVWGHRDPWATLGLALSILLVGLLQAMLGGLGSEPSAGVLYALGAHAMESMRHGEVYRVPLGTLLHATPLHLVLNLSALLALGQFAERRLGATRLLVVAGISGLVGGLFSVLGLPETVAVGSSGMTSGFAGAIVAIAWKVRSAISEWAKAVLFVLVVGGFLLGQLLVFADPTLGVQAHMAGFVAGALTTLGLERTGDGSAAPAAPWQRALAMGLVLVYLAAPLWAWSALATGRACQTLRASSWEAETRTEIREALERYGPTCPPEEGAQSDVGLTP